MEPCLTEAQLRHVADVVVECFFQAHRGVIGVHPVGPLVAFGNEGYSEDEKVRAAVAKTRAALAADGFSLGPVVTSADGYTWVFEAVPPPDSEAEDDAEARVEAAVWEGWAAARDTDLDSNGFARYQRGIATGATAGRSVRVPSFP